MEVFCISFKDISEACAKPETWKGSWTRPTKTLFVKRTERGNCTNHPYYLFRLPSDWCKAQVTPVFKRGDKSYAANYMPISMRCTLCKYASKGNRHVIIMASHLVEHLDKHDLLYVFQFGFRVKGHMRHSLQSTILVEDLARNESTHKQTDLVLLYFPKGI